MQNSEFFMFVLKWLQSNQLNCEYQSRVAWDDTAKPTVTFRIQ
jgi:hypothetical protein